MNYQQTLEYLFTRLPMFSRIGAAAIRPDLNNTISLCAELGNPHKKFKSVHIAGTNGKGSTSHMLAAILQSAGYKTGLYTSPHLKDFRERIKINGEFIPQSDVVNFVQRIIPSIDKLDPSFFEITVAMAFDFFANEKVDIAVIETGLGGRLDSTNVITPDLSVITNIGWDHMHILGNTLPEIALEKAGIIKNNVPVVIGESSKDSSPVFEEQARQKSADIFFADKINYVAEWDYQKQYLSVTVANHRNDEREVYKLDLPGYYQTKNLLTVIESARQLQHLGWKLNPADIHKGLSATRKLTGLHGRWELIHQHPDIVLDVAHNEDGMRQVIAQLELADHHQLHIVIGMVKDKKVDKVLALLPKEAKYYFTKARIPRALPEDQLKELANKEGLHGDCFADVNEALRQARAHAKKEDLILVCGSVFVVGEVDKIN